MRSIKASVLAAGVALAVASSLQAGIAGSSHDFSDDTVWNTSGEICLPCHTPHNALGTIVPLWNHTTTESSFTLYTSLTLDAEVGQPNNASLACLSCHDGTVALDSFGGNTGSTYIGGDANFGTDLSDDHPISFVYDSTLATTDGGLHNPSTKSSGLGNTIDEDLLIGSQMECSSCHDVHNASGLDGLLVIDNAGSALCLTCHDK